MYRQNKNNHRSGFPHKWYKSSNQRGFNILELIATLSITATLTGIGVPAMLDLVRNNRIVVQLNEFVHTLHIARNEAISRSRGVTICKSSNGSSCDSTGTWENGWIVFADQDRDGTVDSGTDTILKVFPKLGGQNELAGATRVTYSPQGMVQTGTGIMTFCDSRGTSHARGISLETSGYVELLEDHNNNGIVDNGATTPVDVVCS